MNFTTQYKTNHPKLLKYTLAKEIRIFSNQIFVFCFSSVIRNIVFILLFTIILSTNAQQLARGKQIDTVICNDNKLFSYSLYLPSNYTDLVKWPVIFSFDPGGNGSRAIRNFIDAAEKYGFILAGSNNSANGNPGNYNLEAAKQMISDVEKKFIIDNRREYTSGFSGGSRIASLVAIELKGIAAVIGCGAGFPGNGYTVVYPSFDYIGIIGSRDMNLIEMRELEQELFKAGNAFELRIFDGGHKWPEPIQMRDAIEWLQLRAMKRKLIEADSSFLIYYLKKYVFRIDSLKKKHEYIEAGRYYSYIKKDFAEFYSKELEVSHDSLINSKEYKKEYKSYDKIMSEEIEIQRELAYAFEDLLIKESFPDSIRFWWNSKAMYFKQMEKGKNKNYQKLASRIINLMTIYSHENGRNYLTQKKYKQAANIYLIATFFNPDEPYYYVQMAKAKALNGNIKGSLSAIKKAVKLGFNDKKLIKTDTSFNVLANEKRFLKILEQMK